MNEATGNNINVSNCGDYFPWNRPTPPYYVYPNTYVTGCVSLPPAPTECRGDVHVFLCQRCGECECGKAKLAKGRK
jgi:hypothetical protein